LLVNTAHFANNSRIQIEDICKVEPTRKPLTDKQEEILGQIIESAGEGDPKTIGLRLVLAASQHKDAGAWPIGLLAKAFHLSGRQLEGDAVYKVASGCRVARFRKIDRAHETLGRCSPLRRHVSADKMRTRTAIQLLVVINNF
jgi:hypothetical protein